MKTQHINSTNVYSNQCPNKKWTNISVKQAIPASQLEKELNPKLVEGKK